MTVLNPDDGYAVLINTFEVPPEKADALVDVLEKATDEKMRHMPGFVSANLHVSADKKRVVNYAQWKSRRDFEAMLADPGAKAHMGAAAKLATSFDPVIYELRYSESA